MQITTQPDENDEIINLEILADHESPINKIRLHSKTVHSFFICFALICQTAS